MTLWRNILLALSLSAFLAACGVNGKPELPPGVDKNHTNDDPSVLDPLI